MSADVDLPDGWNYVHTGLIWHIAENVAPYTPGELALCGKRARWTGDCQGAWPVGKLCRSCRLTWKAHKPVEVSR